MVAIYCRISGKKAEGKDVSIEDQEEQGVNFAKQKNLQYKIYKDVGISGAKDEIEDRPSFAELFTDIEHKIISSVFVIDQSRIERNSRIWQLFSYAIIKYDCDYFVGGNLLNLDDAETRLSTGIISLTNEFYTKITAQKVKSANRINAKKGKGHGITAYGYMKDKEGYLKINEEQALTVRDIFDWSLSGIGTYTIAIKLNEANIPTKSHQYKNRSIEKKDKYTGKIRMFPRNNVRWRGNVIHDMITNPIYKGKRHYGDVVVDIDNIVSEELWNKANSNLSANKKNVGPNNKFKYLLNGLLHCEDCGSEFRGKYRASGRNKTYSCKGLSQGLICSDSRGVNISRLESFIIHHLFHSKDLYNKLSDLKIEESEVEIYQSKLKEARVNLSELEKKKSHFYTLMTNPELADDQTLQSDYIKTTKDIEQTNTVIESIIKSLSELSSMNRQIRLDKIFGEFNYNLNFDQIKQSIHSLIETVTIKHSKKEKLFLVQINYRGFNEQSVFATTHQQMKWINMSHYQVVPITDEDKRHDKDLFNFFATTEKWSREELIESIKHFNAWKDEYRDWNYAQLLDKVKKMSHSEESILNIETSNINLVKEELYDFNRAESIT